MHYINLHFTYLLRIFLKRSPQQEEEQEQQKEE